MKKQSGFTMLEVIAVLVLVGMLSAIAGMGIVRGVEGYIFARENAPTALKAQLVLSRLSREFIEISGVSETTTTSLKFQNLSGDHALAMVDVGGGKVIKLINGTALPTAVTGYTLIDRISSLTMTYKKKDGTNWVQGTDAASLLTTIEITFAVSRPDTTAGSISFSTRINPRNTGTFNAPLL
jgi:prepilin-type N-terminal cleavage/methylation domain-containing protein